MHYPNTIIELDHTFSKDDIEKLNEFLKEEFYIEKDEIEIYKAGDYSSQSDFAGSIFQEIARASLCDDEYW